MIHPIQLLHKYYKPDEVVTQLLIDHSSVVAELAVSIVNANPDLKADRVFVFEASMLHDIGIRFTHAPSIGCDGDLPYICHGYLGADLLRNEGLERHALVAERHTGTGLSLQEIVDRHLPVPHREMTPVSIEEQIVCFADKFFSKSTPNRRASIEEVQMKMKSYGDEHVMRFNHWCRLFIK